MVNEFDTEDILSKLKQRASSRLDEIPPEACIIRGIWHVDYVLKLAKESTTLHLGYVVVQTLEQGCSYYEPSLEDPGLNEGLLGKSVIGLSTGYRCLDIAGLDAVYAHLMGLPDKKYHIEGSNIEKASLRAEIVCNEALSELEKRTPKHGDKFVVVNVGVVGDFLAILSGRNHIKAKASDFYRGVVGKNLFGVTVSHGSHTLEMLAEADLAIITGMTLANGSLGEILKVARENQTVLAMFAETGAHFASEYCQLGIDVVVSEPLPFYLTGTGSTSINIYRRSAKTDL